ncbi:hypothetical protein [Methylocystis iwaonis]|uniref:hypothetical protein n=1 Tax=Methylocystis iwaonis TaxID=2885079 RepID=UPI002492CCC9|nr:hypothetical protein [Methylocystis iwaonis]
MIAVERLRPTLSTSPAAIFRCAILGASLLAAAPAFAQQTQPTQPAAPRQPKSQAAKPKAPATAVQKSPATKPGTAKPSTPTTPQGVVKQPPAAPPADAGAPLAPLPPVDTSTPPPMLPRAARERMRICAEEWEKHKRASRAAQPLWREFATECLTR